MNKISCYSTQVRGYNKRETKRVLGVSKNEVPNQPFSPRRRKIKYCYITCSIDRQGRKKISSLALCTKQKLTRLGLRSVHLVAHLLGSSVKWLQKYIVLFVHLLSHSSSSTTHRRKNQSSCLLKLGSKFPKREKKHPTTIATSPHHHHHHTCYNIKNNKKYSSSA